MWACKANERKNEGVSAVIAVILMVAITVVLAGVLYMWIWGITDQPDERPLPMGGTARSYGIQNTNYNISVHITTAAKSVPLRDCRVIIKTPEDVNLYTADFSGITPIIGRGAKIYAPTSWIPSQPAQGGIKILDNDGDGNLGVGDYIYVYDENGAIGLSSGWKVELRVDNKPVGTWTG